MYKLVVVILSVGAFAFVQAGSSPEFQAKVRPLALECQGESTDITDKDVDDLVNLSPELSSTGKCLLACVEEKIGFIKDGGFNSNHDEVSAAYQWLFEGDEEALKHEDEAIGRCFEEGTAGGGDDLCEVAFIGYTCFLGLF